MHQQTIVDWKFLHEFKFAFLQLCIFLQSLDPSKYVEKVCDLSGSVLS